MFSEEKKDTLNDIAEAVIKEINDRKNPFDKITLVFHSTKIAQWFKAYYLKQENSVLMNVECKTLSSFINETINPNNENHVLTASEYREYIIRALLENLPSKSYYNDGKKINGINLYEYADKLSTVFFNMEFDNEEIGVTPESAWERKIYQDANQIAKKQKCYTPKQMFIKNIECLLKTEESAYLINNSYISELYIEILKKCGSNIKAFSLEDKAESDNKCKVELCAAPSKMREVEKLHSDICQKIAEEKDVLVNDFVVYAPNINDYANTIRRVFQRSAPGFPEVPFRIIGESTEKHDMISALRILHHIAGKGFFTRYDLLKMLKMPMFMRVKDLTNEDISAFMDAIEATNTHRNGDDNEDWTYFKKRLLSSFVAEGNISLRDGDTVTYSSMDMDFDRVNKLVDIIDEMANWSGLFADGDFGEKEVDRVAISAILNCLDKLFSLENQYGEEKNYLYSDVKQEVKRMQDVFDSIKIPAITFLLLLQDAPNRYSSSPADVFAGGVTFLSLDIDNIVSGKYVYVLGMSSNNFPRIENKNEIDYSSKHQYTHVLDKKAFQNLMANSNAITVSFVYCDLQTEEEFFPSNVIPATVRTQYSEHKQEHCIPFDESRNNNELFTSRELLNKKRIVNIGAENIVPPNPTKAENQDLPKIYTGQVKKYLENTIVYKYSKLLQDSEDEDETKNNEYEDIDFGGLKEYSAVKEIILAAVHVKEDGSYFDWNEIEASVRNRMKITKKLPNKLEDEYFNALYENKAKSVIEEICKGYQKIEAFSLNMGDWVLEMNSLCFLKEEGTTLSFIEPKGAKDKVSNKDFLLSYVCALAVVACKNNDTQYSVALKSKKDMTFGLNSASAQETLKNIVSQMLTVENIRYMDIELYSDCLGEIGEADIATIDINTLKKVPKSIEDLLDTIHNHSTWTYFNDKQMLNPNVDFGFDSTKESIVEDVLSEFLKIKEVVLFGKEEQK